MHAFARGEPLVGTWPDLFIEGAHKEVQTAARIQNTQVIKINADPRGLGTQLFYFEFSIG
jgi:hypothetical protein